MSSHSLEVSGSLFKVDPSEQSEPVQVLQAGLSPTRGGSRFSILPSHVPVLCCGILNSEENLANGL